jgi:hypothetical protein
MSSPMPPMLDLQIVYISLGTLRETLNKPVADGLT